MTYSYAPSMTQSNQNVVFDWITHTLAFTTVSKGRGNGEIACVVAVMQPYPIPDLIFEVKPKLSDLEKRRHASR